MKVLSPRTHAPIDYLLVALFGLAPTLLGFAGIAETVCYGAAVAVLAMSLLTAYPLGVLKVIPFRVHGYVELVAVPLLLAAPFALGFDEIDPARNFFLVTGVAYAIVWSITDYKAVHTDLPEPRAPRPRMDRPHVSNRPMF